MEDQALSWEINSCFNASGYNEYTRHFGYSEVALKEFITNTAKLTDKSYWKVVGSRLERTYLPGSDSDCMLINQCGTVGYNPQESTYSNKVYFRLTSGPSTRAGYTKLQIYRNGKPIEIDYNKSFRDNDFVNISEGKPYLNNKSVFPLKTPLNEKSLYIEIHGPAATSTLYKHTLDSIQAYESQIIPKEMMPWFERYRRYNWPIKETRDLFKSMGCCYVGVGHSKSQDQRLEWRISPTRQELYLMLNLNPTQYRCYIAMKVLKKEFIEYVCDDMFSSYHCKTALFYTIETTNPDIWQPHNLIKCLLKCLKLLLCWIKKRNCPNYFIKEENMFETKLIENDKLHDLQLLLGILVNTPGSLGFLMYHIQNLTWANPEKESIWSKAMELKWTLTNAITSDITQCSISEKKKKIMTIYNKIKCPTEQNNLVEIKKLRPYEPDYVLIESVLKEMLLHLKIFEHLLSVLKKTMTLNKYLDKHKDSTEALPENFQYCLKLASIAMAQKDYVNCDKLLQTNRNIAFRACVICCCDLKLLIKETTARMIDKTTYACDQKLTSAGKCINSMTVNQIMQQFTICLNFNDIELEGRLVMAPLHLERYKTLGKSLSKRVLSEDKETLTDLMTVHPVTYMYFLQYKNSEMMKQTNDMCVALEKLENMNLVSLQKGIYSHADIILNLLGHIYITKEWYRLAIQCFKRSWELLPDYNSAKWHTMFLLFGSSEKCQ